MVRKEGKGRYGQEGKYQSDRTNPLQEETKLPCHQKHGILEVPEETDCNGITSVNKTSFLSRSQSRDREE
ncbi:hypothetical protein T01_14431 [Trichinella spiralis]|uniref:Uncharacterized protein n=1 Tax=Trichinella spiralis TaxID=6334 RepID=A0A0V1BKR9_TRISP|nr:hypothetical protein T01_14431 [Trichinella spiralis]